MYRFHYTPKEKSLPASPRRRLRKRSGWEAPSFRGRNIAKKKKPPSRGSFPSLPEQASGFLQ